MDAEAFAKVMAPGDVLPLSLMAACCFRHHSAFLWHSFWVYRICLSLAKYLSLKKNGYFHAWYFFVGSFRKQITAPFIIILASVMFENSTPSKVPNCWVGIFIKVINWSNKGTREWYRKQNQTVFSKTNVNFLNVVSYV